MIRRDFLKRLGMAIPASTVLTGEVISGVQEGSREQEGHRPLNEYAAHDLPITWHLNQKTREVLGTFAAFCTAPGVKDGTIPFQVRCMISKNPDTAIEEKVLALRDALEMVREFEKTSLKWKTIRWIYHTPPDLEKRWLKKSYSQSTIEGARRMKVIGVHHLTAGSEDE